MLVDLPGYGFAKVSGNQRINWEKLIIHYLENSDDLVLVNLLIDARRGIKENDIQLMHLLKSNKKNFQIIFTKADKIKSKEQFIKEMNAHLLLLGFECRIILTSSRSGEGAKELQISILQLL